MNFKTNSFLILSFSMCLVSGCGLTDSTPTITFSHILSEESEWHVGAEAWKEKVNAELGDSIRIRLITNASLSNNNQRTELEMVQAGTLGGSWESSILLSVVDPRWTVWSLPWLFDSYEEAQKVCQSELGQDMLASLEEKGIIGLAYGFNGFRRLTNSTHPVSRLADLEGLKIRVPSLQMFITLYRTWGADPSQMNFGDVMLALREGTMDGQENPLHVIRSSKVYETQQYITMWNYSFDPLIFCISKKVWDTLSPDQQESIRVAAIEASAQQRQTVMNNETSHISFLIQNGLEISTPTQGSVEEFLEASQPVYTNYRDTIGPELMDRFLQATGHQ